MKAIVIGNSPSVLEYEYGKFIDEYFDVVIRCNWYRIEGFEKYVGTKTDVWSFRHSPEFIDAVAGKSETHRLDDTIHDVNQYWIRTAGPPAQNWTPPWTKEKVDYELQELKKQWNPKSGGIFTKLGYLRLLENIDMTKVTHVFGTDSNCIGLQLVKIACDKYDEVWSFGNTFYTENVPNKKGRYHYYDLEDSTSRLDREGRRVHDYNQEMKVLKGLNVKILEYENIK